MNLTDELTKKQLDTFQINEVDGRVDFESINKALLKKDEGIFRLDSNICTTSAEIITNTLKRNNENYGFELSYAVKNYEIMFKKKGANN